MIEPEQGRHRAGRRRSRRGPVLIGILSVVVLAVAAGLVAWSLHGRGAPAAVPGGAVSSPAAPDPGSTSPTSTSPASTSPASASPAGTSPTPTAPAALTTSPAATTSRAKPSSTHPVGPPPVVTPGGMWWGVDSSGPITADALANVHDWYQGARPQFWGRYLAGSYGVTQDELAYARSQGLYVYLLVGDKNCSQCDGQDVCGNDLSAAQAQDDADIAVAEAERLSVKRPATLFKDIEQISSCHGEPTGEYLTTWYRTVRASGYATGFYGNTFTQSYDFPRGYCAAVKADSRFAHDVVLDMNEDEPRLGAPSGTTGPHNAPAFAPLVPDCAPSTATKVWQYGESTDSGNYTDIDQMRPDTPGLLAPDGSIT